MGKHFIPYVGQIFQTSHSGKCKVLEYHDNTKVKVKFLDTGFVRFANTRHLRVGSVKDPYAISVYGIGYFGDGPYKGNSKLYALWASMLERCYSPRSLKRFPSYLGCTVVKRWHNFQNFCVDILNMKNWKIKGFHLDKDLRVFGNRKYGPKYCSFVPAELNTVFVNTSSVNLAVENGKYKVGIRLGNRRKHLGLFRSKKKALEVYLSEKISHVKKLALQYKNKLHSEVFENLMLFGGEHDSRS